MIKIRTGQRSRICQGDVFNDIEHVEYIAEKGGNIEISKIIFPLAVVLTQDCDLKQDYRYRWSRREFESQDKWLVSVLVAPLYNVEHVYVGGHLNDIGLKMETINKNKSPGKFLRSNERPRYHFISFPEAITIVDSVVDFKHYFSVNVKYLKKIHKTNFVCRLAELHRENLSQRFASYLSRIALP